MACISPNRELRPQPNSDRFQIVVLVLHRDLADSDESLPAVLMTRFPLTDDDTGQRRLYIDVPVIDVRLEIALILGAEGAVRAAEGRRLATLIQQVPLQDVRVLVTLTASRAVVPAIVMHQAAAAADAGVIVITTGRVPRWTMQPRTTLRRQRCRHVAHSRRRRRRRRGVRAPRDAPRAVAGPTEAGEETCKRHKQTCRRYD